MARLRLWGFSWRLLIGFALVILITIAAFSVLLLGRLEYYLLHDMENSLANQARMARGSIEFALRSADVEGVTSLSETELAALRRLARILAVQTACRIVVTDADGVDIIDSAGDSLLGIRFKSDEFVEAMESGYGAYTRVDPLSHQYTMYVAYPIRNSSGVQGVIRVSKPTSSVRSLLHTIEGRIAFSGLIAGVAAILVSVVFAFVLARPIRKIRIATTRFGRGDLSARSNLKGQGDLAELSHSFDRMADRIERSMTELSKLDELKSDFVANVSHDLKTPLTAIRGLSETLLDGALDDGAVNREFVMDIASEAERLLVMVNNLLNLARLEAGALEVNTEPVDAGALVEEIALRLAPLAHKRAIAVSVRVDEAAPRALVDRSMLDQAITNVLDNAIKYSPAAGEVRVTVSSDMTSTDGGMLVDVSDQGPGIPAEEMEHIFERFYRGGTEGPRTGSGIGLAIARRNMEAMGGDVRIASSSEKGTTVRITFPTA
ncbi:MAG: ATP-binding protein [Actinomycetota bacterium]